MGIWELASGFWKNRIQSGWRFANLELRKASAGIEPRSFAATVPVAQWAVRWHHEGNYLFSGTETEKLGLSDPYLPFTLKVALLIIFKQL